MNEVLDVARLISRHGVGSAFRDCMWAPPSLWLDSAWQAGVSLFVDGPCSCARCDNCKSRAGSGVVGKGTSLLRRHQLAALIATAEA